MITNNTPATTVGSPRKPDKRLWRPNSKSKPEIGFPFLEVVCLPKAPGKCWPARRNAAHALPDFVTAKGDTFAGRTFIDAAYEGDLMAAAKVTWVIGCEGRKEFGESLAVKKYSKASMAITGVMHTHEWDEMERRLALAADYGESLNA